MWVEWAKRRERERECWVVLCYVYGLIFMPRVMSRERQETSVSVAFEMFSEWKIKHTHIKANADGVSVDIDTRAAHDVWRRRDGHRSSRSNFAAVASDKVDTAWPIDRSEIQWAHELHCKLCGEELTKNVSRTMARLRVFAAANRKNCSTVYLYL